jgi:hypothetical protein
MSHLDALAAAFHDGGLPAALATHQRQRRSSLRYAAATAPLDACVPLADVCDQITRLGDDAVRRGLGPAARAALRRWELDPVVVVHPRAWELLEKGPFLAYGNHVTGLEAAVFSSLSDRPDLYHVAGTFVAAAAPGLAPMLLTVGGPARDDRSGERRTKRNDEPGERQAARNDEPGERQAAEDAEPFRRRAVRDGGRRPVRERLLREVERAVWPASPRGNLGTLQRAAELIGDGAGVHVFPAGTMHPGSPWQPGAGWLVRRLLRERHGAYLFPVVYGISDAHLAASALFRRRPVTRALARAAVALTGPLSIYVPAPVRIGRLGAEPQDSSRVITELLLGRWRAARAEAAAAIPGWRAAPATLRAGVGGRHRRRCGWRRPAGAGGDGR